MFTLKRHSKMRDDQVGINLVQGEIIDFFY